MEYREKHAAHEQNHWPRTKGTRASVAGPLSSLSSRSYTYLSLWWPLSCLLKKRLQSFAPRFAHCCRCRAARNAASRTASLSKWISPMTAMTSNGNRCEIYTTATPTTCLIGTTSLCATSKSRTVLRLTTAMWDANDRELLSLRLVYLHQKL